MRSFTKLAATIVIVALLCSAVSTASAEQVDNVAKFMRVKMNHAHKVLEGLALEDFDAIAKHSQEMSLLSQAASWQVLQTPEYRQQSTDFRRAANALTEAAQKKNLDGASIAYVEMTLKCVQCHKYVRRVRMAQADAPADATGQAPALSQVFVAHGVGATSSK